MAARVTHAGRSARSGCSRRRYRVSPTSFLCSRKNATRLTMIRHRSSSSLMLKATFRPHDSRSEDSRPPTFEIGVHSRLTSCSRNGRSGGLSRQAEKPLDSRLHRRGSSHDEEATPTPSSPRGDRRGGTQGTRSERRPAPFGQPTPNRSERSGASAGPSNLRPSARGPWDPPLRSPGGRVNPPPVRRHAAAATAAQRQQGASSLSDFGGEVRGLVG